MARLRDFGRLVSERSIEWPLAAAVLGLLAAMLSSLLPATRVALVDVIQTLLRGRGGHFMVQFN